MLGITYIEVVTWLSMFLSAAAGWANMYGVWVWRGRPLVQMYYGTVATFAWFYSSGYIWLIVNEDRLAWSEFYGRFGPLVWFFVWNVPPLAAARARRRELEALTYRARAAEEQLAARDKRGFTL